MSKSQDEQKNVHTAPKVHDNSHSPRNTIEVEFQGGFSFKVSLRSPATNICEALSAELNLDLTEVFEYLLMYSLTADLGTLFAYTEALLRRKHFYNGN